MTSDASALFSARREAPPAPLSFAISVLAHAAAIAGLSFGVLYNPEVQDRTVRERYLVRRIELHADPTPAQPHSAIEAPAQIAAEGSNAPRGQARETAHSAPGSGRAAQLLVQPSAPLRVELKEEVPIPTVAIWLPERKIPETIVPPARQKLTASEVVPSLQPPNEEPNLSELGVSSTNLAPQKQAVAAGATSPLVMHGPDPAPVAPQTVTQTSAPPTPAAVVSLSQLRMNDGSITLPDINQSAGKQDSTQPGSRSAANAEKLPGAEASRNNASSKTANAAPDALSATAAGGEKDGAVARIALPKDGQFGAVVVGSSLQEKYPETADLWAGRMAYTVYLHVGLAKSWILQYSLPRSEEAAAAGNIARIEAPWPYNIVRPNLASGAIDADALMVHGYVNQAGRFENLAVAFPPNFSESQFVLATLAQWQFRPARQNGQSARVEVLLIIPEVP